MYAATPEGAWGAIHGVQNSGAGYDEWVDAGGSRSAWEYPLIQVAAWVGGEALAVKLFGKIALTSQKLIAARIANSTSGKMWGGGQRNESRGQALP